MLDSSFLLCLSWLLHSQGQEFWRNLWITLCVCVCACARAHVCVSARTHNHTIKEPCSWNHGFPNGVPGNQKTVL
jgi:hypothetical protein